MKTDPAKKIYVTASEIGEFVYCPRAWWLRFNDKSISDTFVLEEGRRQHDVLAKELKRADIAFMIGLLLISIGVILLMLFIGYRWINGTL